uniref:Aurora kinase n=1 Tax=Alexandrium monilatum TaxID=311494 RepID=A0A7S4QTY4_9DINO
MNCGRRQCKRTVRSTPSYCRCGTEFCSEACFVSEWHAEHQKTCSRAAEIKQEIESRRCNTGRSGAALLVCVALSRVPPAPPPELLSDEADVAPAVAARRASAPQLEVKPDDGAAPPPAAAEARPPEARTPADEAPPVTAPPPTVAASKRPDLRRAATAACDGGKAAVSSSPTQPIRRYQLDEFVTMGDPIGSGSYGMVSKVISKNSGEVFAMKTITKKKVLEHKMTSYLTREVKTQIKINHPNILRLVYYFEDAQNVFLLLEYAKGGSLFSVLRKRGLLPEAEVAGLFADVAGALDFLHRHGIVHRDLKPENILMCDGNVAKLADFGWCAELSKDGGLRNTFCGTWDYLSPEMVNNEPHDFTVDIWAMGVLLFEMLTGKPPFAASSQMKAITRITKVDLQIPDSVSPGARDLISKLIVRERRRRLSLADAVRHRWISSHVPNAELKVRPAPPCEALGPGAGGGHSASAEPRAPAGLGAAGTAAPALAGWECQPEPGIPTGWGGAGDKATAAAAPDASADRRAHGEAAAPSAAVARAAVREGAGTAAAGADAGRREPLDASPKPEDPAQAHSTVSGLGGSLAPLGLGDHLQAPPAGLPWESGTSGSEGLSEKPALPVVSTLSSRPSSIRHKKLNDFMNMKKHLDSAMENPGHNDHSAPSTASASSTGTDSERRRVQAATTSLESRSPAPTPANAKPPLAYTLGIEDSALSHTSLQPTTPKLSRRPLTPPAREAGAEQGLAAVAPGALTAVPKDAPYSPQRMYASPGASPSRGRTEPWQQTNTFAAIRKWVRQNSVAVTPLGEELDRTLPGSALPAAGREEVRAADPFSLPVTSGDQLAPLPKRRATTSRRRASGIDATQSGMAPLGTGSISSTGSGSPAEDSAHRGGGGIFRGDRLSGSSSPSPVAGALRSGLPDGALADGGTGAHASGTRAGERAGTAPRIAAVRQASPMAVLAASPQTAPVSSLLVSPAPRIDEFRELATRMQDLRSQIDRDLDSSCRALKFHFEHQDGDTRHPLWREIEQVVAGPSTALSPESSALLRRWRAEIGMDGGHPLWKEIEQVVTGHSTALSPESSALLGRWRAEIGMAGGAAADRAAGYTPEAAAADRAAGVAAAGGQR